MTGRKRDGQKRETGNKGRGGKERKRNGPEEICLSRYKYNALLYDITLYLIEKFALSAYSLYSLGPNLVFTCRGGDLQVLTSYLACQLVYRMDYPGTFRMFVR